MYRWFFVAWMVMLGSSPLFALQILVTLPPLVEGVQAISPSGTVVSAVMSSGQDADSLVLSVAQIRRLAQADLIVSTGQMPFEKQIAKRCANDPVLAKKLLLVLNAADLKQHEHDDFHSGADPHTWMSVALMRQMMMAVHTQLIEQLPQQRVALRHRFLSYDQKLIALDQDLQRLLKPHRGKSILVFHPALGYLCDEYHIRQITVEHHTQTTSGRFLVALSNELKTARISTLFYEKGATNRQIDAVAEQLNLKKVALDLQSTHYIETMRDVGQKIAEASLKSKPGF